MTYTHIQIYIHVLYIDVDVLNVHLIFIVKYEYIVPIKKDKI